MGLWNKKTMNMKKIKTTLLFLLVLFTTFSSCRKEGPQGPPGNANVKSSTITFSNWGWDNTSNYNYADFTWPDITSSIVNNGAVMVYLNTSTGYVQLPRVIYPASTYSESQRFVYNVGTLRIIVQDSDLLPPSPALGTWTIKVLAIESSAIQANPDVNWENYSEVKAQFGLPD